MCGSFGLSSGCMRAGLSSTLLGGANRALASTLYASAGFSGAPECVPFGGDKGSRRGGDLSDIDWIPAGGCSAGGFLKL